MKSVFILVFLVAPSVFALSGEIFCRNLVDFRKIVLIRPAQPPADSNRLVQIVAATDEYENNGIQIVANRMAHISENKLNSHISGYNVDFLLRNVPPHLSKVYVDGDFNALFSGQLLRGLSRLHDGKYACVRGYLALTIQGNEPNGGLSISVNGRGY